jgi:hypothetical protein
MSIEQVESAILQLTPDDRKRLLLWLDENRHELFSSGPSGLDVTEAQKSELFRRRQEYFDHPERFIHLETGDDLDRFFKDIRRDVQARVSSALPR